MFLLCELLFHKIDILKEIPPPIVIICFYYVNYYFTKISTRKNYLFLFMCVLNFKTIIKFYNLVFMITTLLLHDYFIYLIKGLLK